MLIIHFISHTVRSNNSVALGFHLVAKNCEKSLLLYILIQYIVLVVVIIAIVVAKIIVIYSPVQAFSDYLTRLHITSWKSEFDLTLSS